MDTVFFSKARAELAGLLDKVNEDAAAVEIVRRDKPSAILIGKEEYEGMMETIHLLSSPANAAYQSAWAVTFRTRACHRHRPGCCQCAP